MREHIIGDFYVEQTPMMRGPDRFHLTQYMGRGYHSHGTFSTPGLARAFARREWAAILRQQEKDRNRVRGY